MSFDSVESPGEDSAVSDLEQPPSRFPYSVVIMAVVVIVVLFFIVGWFSAFPRSHSDVVNLQRQFKSFNHQNPHQVLLIFSIAYILLQSCAIPGTVFLSLLAGPLFGFYKAIILVTGLATIGSCCCYCLSSLLAQSCLDRCFPSLLSRFRSFIEDQQADHNLLYQLLFLRISPILPNWFINLASPHLRIPFYLFTLATLIGLLPANYIHISTGLQLEALQDLTVDSTAEWSSALYRIAALLLLASAALLPTLYNNQQKRNMEKLLIQNNGNNVINNNSQSIKKKE